MKATVSSNQDFKPVTITITLESRNELDALASLFNCSPLCEAMENIGGQMPPFELLNKLALNNGESEVLLKAILDTPYMQRKLLNR
ncbi:MAG: hypothetical protein KGL39_49830 [Patescibacteria group bacterium]|nr:hypothetical protein [Patescibacteria group bacterium]